MKRLFAIILIMSLTTTTYSQDMNSSLRQLEYYLEQQGFSFTYCQSQSNTMIGRTTFQWNAWVSGWYDASTYQDNMGEETKQQYSIKKLSHQNILNAIDTTRNTFSRISKDASESFLYEYHENNMDTIRYNLIFRFKDDSPNSPNSINNVNYTNIRESVGLKYYRDKSNRAGCFDEMFMYDHNYSMPNGLTKDDIQPFDIPAFEALIKPVLNSIKKLKGASINPVYWQYDEGFESNDLYGSNKHMGLTTGTYYFIPAQYDKEIEALYTQLATLAQDYVNRHPEQSYHYYYYHNPIPNVSNLREILNCNSQTGGDKYRLSFLINDNGYYDGFHILSITTKGEYKLPKDWQTLKSYINGEKTYLK